MKKNEFSLNEKSASLSKNKKVRLHTDYVDYDYLPYQANHTHSFGNLKPKSTKKSSLGNSNPFKRKESLSKQDNRPQFKLSNNYAIKDYVVNSTKFDSKKNNDLKSLFNNPYESKIKNYKKAKQINHNCSVFLNLKPKKANSIMNNVVSPYSQQINRFVK